MYAIIVDEKTKACNVGVGTDTEFYKSIGMVDMEVEQGYDGQWYVKGYAPTQPLDELKQAKITELKAKRDELEVEPISYQGYNFDYDDKARDRISAAIIALDVSKGQIAWTTADNIEVMLNADDLRGVVAAVAMRSNKLHNAYRTAKEKVLEATTKEEVENVVLNNG